MENDRFDKNISRCLPVKVARAHAAGDIAARRKSLQTAVKWARLGPDSAAWSSALFTGPTGAGKSWAAAIVVANEPYSFDRPVPRDCVGGGSTVCSRWESVPGALYVTAIELGRLVMGAHLGRPSARLQWLKACPLVAVDDLGREVFDQSGYIKAGLFEFLTGRFDSEQRTIVTTNLNDSALSERYGSALFDRFQAHGIVCELDETDYVRE